MNKENFESRAEKLLRDTDAYRVPVAIDKVAERLNITLEAAALGEKVSGLLLVKNERGAIGYNLAHARVRQRLTISHEIAHFVLHAKKGAKEQLFIDRYITFRPDENLSPRADRDEAKANQLGAALLMPKDLVQQEIQKQDLNLDDDDAINLLAKKFCVSAAAMSNRLVNIGLLR